MGWDGMGWKNSRPISLGQWQLVFIFFDVGVTIFLLQVGKQAQLLRFFQPSSVILHSELITWVSRYFGLKSVGW